MQWEIGAIRSILVIIITAVATYFRPPARRR